MPFTLELGADAPDFKLRSVDGKMFSLADFAAARVLVVAFTCNHCPYVIGLGRTHHAIPCRIRPARRCASRPSSSNEDQQHPTDSFDHMVAAGQGTGF